MTDATEARGDPIGPETDVRTGAPAPARATLRRRALLTTAWHVGGATVQRSMRLVSNLIMTRLLAPEAFGLMAIVLTVLTMAEMISDIGVRQSIVRSERGEEPGYLRVAWTVQILRSGVVAGLVLATAALLWALGPAFAPQGSVYADPTLPALVAVASLATLFRGLESTTMFRASRRLDVSRVMLTELGCQAATLVGMVTLALMLGASVWVLLAGLLIGFALRAALSHVIFPDLPMRLAWDREVAAEMWRFGRWIIGSSMAGFVVYNGDRFVLGFLLDAETFGLYAVAMLWLQAGVSMADKVVSESIFGALAETLRERRAAFPRLLAKIRRPFDAVLVVAFAGVVLCAEPLLRLLYTPEYLGAAAILALLSLRFLTQRQLPLQSFLVAEGRSDLIALSTGLGAATVVVGVPLAWHLAGLEAAVLVVALAPLAGAPVVIAGAKRRMPAVPVRSDVFAVIGVLALAAGLYVWSGPGGPW